MNLNLNEFGLKMLMNCGFLQHIERISLQDLAVKLYHTNFSSNVDSDQNENSG